MDFDEVILQAVEAYHSIVSTLPLELQRFSSLFFVVVLMVVYSVFIWKLHKFIGTKNIFELNLGQYNKSEHPAVAKVAAVLLYIMEYIIVLPILIFFWFAIFSLFLILVIEVDLSAILFVSAAVIATIRITAYIPGYGERLSREIAKLLPMTLLAIALLTPDFFDIERIIGNLSKLGNFFSLIFEYLLFIVILEILLRFFELFLDMLGIKDTKEEEKEDAT